MHQNRSTRNSIDIVVSKYYDSLIFFFCLFYSLYCFFHSTQKIGIIEIVQCFFQKFILSKTTFEQSLYILVFGFRIINNSISSEARFLHNYCKRYMTLWSNRRIFQSYFYNFLEKKDSLLLRVFHILLKQNIHYHFGTWFRIFDLYTPMHYVCLYP